MMDSSIKTVQALKEVQSQFEWLQSSVEKQQDDVQEVAGTTSFIGRRLEALSEMIEKGATELDATHLTVQEMKQKLAELEVKLEEKNREVHALHEIIQQSGSGRDDPVTDDQISRMFDRLSHAILRVVSGHFNTARPTGAISRGRDHPLHTRAMIASILFNSFFNPTVKLLGLSPPYEDHQREFEQYMISSAVSEEKITQWRVLVIEMGQKVAENTGNELSEPIWEAAEALRSELLKSCSMPSGNLGQAMQKALDGLCIQARNIALILRKSQNTYIWHQDNAHIKELSSIEDVDRIRLSSIAFISPGAILFGPVYKMVDNEKILIRKGEVLSTNWEWPTTRWPRVRHRSGMSSS